ncbi:hypothetical protein C5S31_02600 [ANME-1 cluster archaeon GoMg2]|nr:hypothetical protein [ANME-1 cluster archaeon GoMg2]
MSSCQYRLRYSSILCKYLFSGCHFRGQFISEDIKHLRGLVKYYVLAGHKTGMPADPMPKRIVFGAGAEKKIGAETKELVRLQALKYLVLTLSAKSSYEFYS